MNPMRTSVVLMERRQALRAPANRGATIRFADTELRCTVLNLSSAGVGLYCDEAGRLPKSFLLQIDDETQTRQCRVVWRDSERVGATFE